MDRYQRFLLRFLANCGQSGREQFVTCLPEYRVMLLEIAGLEGNHPVLNTQSQPRMHSSTENCSGVLAEIIEVRSELRVCRW